MSEPINQRLFEEYGVIETNPMGEQEEKFREEQAQVGMVIVDWTDKRLARITRLRLLGDRGIPWLDISYCHGYLRDGTPVEVRLDVPPLRKHEWKGQILKAARDQGVYAKGLGLFDQGVVSILI